MFGHGTSVRVGKLVLEQGLKRACTLNLAGINICSLGCHYPQIRLGGRMIFSKQLVRGG